MPEYDFKILQFNEFECLCRDLLQKSGRLNCLPRGEMVVTQKDAPLVGLEGQLLPVSQTGDLHDGIGDLLELVAGVSV